MVHPYIVFHGNCREALNFYETVFDTQVLMTQTYGDYVPEGTVTPPVNLAEWVLHAEMEISGIVCWFADDVKEVISGSQLKLSATVATASEAQRIFGSLRADGRVTLEPVVTFYSSFHGAVIDPFGIEWNIIAEEPPQGI